MKIEGEILSPPNSSALVIRTGLRRYASLAIQGDTLFLMSDAASTIYEKISKGVVDEEVVFEMQRLSDQLSGLSRFYDKYGLEGQKIQ